jgi:hypothetical protein
MALLQDGRTFKKWGLMQEFRSLGHALKWLRGPQTLLSFFASWVPQGEQTSSTIHSCHGVFASAEAQK